MFSTVLDCRQSLSEFSFCFSHTWLRGHRLGCIALFEVTKIPILFHPQISEGFDNCGMIPDSQAAIKLERVYCSSCKIFTVFSIYTSLQAGCYHIKRRLTLRLQFGWSLDWYRPVVSLQSRRHRTVL